MNFYKNLFLFNKKSENKNGFNQEVFDHYEEIAKLVKKT